MKLQYAMRELTLMH